ncbi:hypothetical protein GCK32_009643 [Trichostrongylus colubriformis]|uniref:C-type lectin domain-containing protein n=1 Tax=Trichostrongylus colubriformis TaxID=6319 RepID=A0AAN8F598_TRICO
MRLNTVATPWTSRIYPLRSISLYSCNIMPDTPSCPTRMFHRVWFTLSSNTSQRTLVNMLSYLVLAILPAPLLSYDRKVDKQYMACSPWIYRTENGYCYRKFCQRTGFDEASTTCQHRVGGWLATACDKDTNDFLGRLAQYHYHPVNKHDKYTTLGLHWSEGNWKWHNPSARIRDECKKFFPWYPGEPSGRISEYFVVYSTTFASFELWSDLTTYTTFHWICEIIDCDYTKYM